MYIYHTKKPTQNLFLHVCPVLPHNESMIQIQWFIIKHHGTHNPIPQQSAKKSLLIHTHTHSHILQHATIQTLLNTRSLINVKLHTRTAQGNIRNALFSSGVLFNFLLWSYFFPEPPSVIEGSVAGPLVATLWFWFTACKLSNCCCNCCTSCCFWFSVS